VNTQSYYEDLKLLARQVRAEHGISSPRVLAHDLMRIYAKYGITVDEWPYRFRKLRGAFMNDELGPTVLLARGLPQDPRVFTMAHELKHFFRDRDLGISYCEVSNLNKSIEIGAEIFAAELLFPDRDFVSHMRSMGIRANQCLPKTLIQLKRQTGTTLSYAGLAIKAEWLGFAPSHSLTTIKTWRRLEAIHSPPPARRPIRHSMATPHYAR
jgi:Zn-dependent peptidase ImmA (M78 family)